MARTMPGLLVYRVSEGQTKSLELQQDVITVGRSDACAVVLPFPTVSRLHARIEMQHDRFILVDLGSANGTFVNGARLAGNCPLNTGDIIWVGSRDVELTFTDPEETVVVRSPEAPPALSID